MVKKNYIIPNILVIHSPHPSPPHSKPKWNDVSSFGPGWEGEDYDNSKNLWDI
jgi:hypothetical protein